jgi:DNA-directed RNA polymerase specialized sigma24 family protein
MRGSGVWWNANCAINRARSELADRRDDMPRTRRVSDTSLVRRSQQGDRRAFRALLNRYDWRVHGLAHALLLDPARVDAVLRVAYIRAWREVVRIDAKDDASAWLYRVAYNACIDVLRRESARAGTVSPNGAAALGPDRAAASPAGRVDRAAATGAGAGVSARDGGADAHGPEAPAAARDGGGDGAQPPMIAALTSLAAADRVAVVLVDREGFAPSAAARILGLTDEVLEARLAGARVRLARQAGLTVVAASPLPRTDVAEQGDGGEQEERDDGVGEQEPEGRSGERHERDDDGRSERLEQDDDGDGEHDGQVDGGERLEQDDGDGDRHERDDDGDGEHDEQVGGGERLEQDDGDGLDDPDATVDHDRPGKADEPGADDTRAGPGAGEAEGPSVVAKVVASRSGGGTTGNGAKPSEGSS